MTKIKDIPKKEALIILGDALIEEGKGILKDLSGRLTKLMAIKKELLQL